MTHHYKTKISKNDVREYAKRIGEQFSPEKIIWFGSYATGQADSDSDVDLFVILNFRGRAPQKAYEIRKAIPRAFPLDLIVRTPDEVERRIEIGDLFVRDILEKGMVLYEKDRP